MVVELVPFLALVGECLLLPDEVLLAEGDRVLPADLVQEFGEILLLDSWSGPLYGKELVPSAFAFGKGRTC